MVKTVFWGLFVAGFVACSTVGIGPALKRAGGDWASPWMVAGVVLGLAIAALAVAFVTGYRPPVLATDASMVIAMGVLIGGKVLVSVGQQLVQATARG